MASKLATIAAGMRRSLAGRERGWVQTTLAGGLELVLSREGELWRLALRREAAAPSATEAAVCAPLFGAPAEAEPARRSAQGAHPVSGRPVLWQVVEFSWIER